MADGAWGTELAARGLPAGEAPDVWNLQRPDDVRAVAVAYVEAGADIILTNTFGASPLKLAYANLDDRTEEINRRGVELSLEAAAGRALVFASIGPSGALLEPLGTVREEDMVAQFARQARAIAEAGADGIVIETMTALDEAKAALRAVREVCDLPVVVSMTFDRGPRGFATMMGVQPAQAAEKLTAAGADVVGANCGAGIAQIIEVARRMRTGTSLPLWCKPNAGLPRLVGGHTIYEETPEEMVRHVADLVDAGARIIGGCCGTTPAHVRLLAAECARIAGTSTDG
ncbi:MAG: methionine synthase [Candidatus Brocadiaceae bacterium]|nr:methionine synthase [Candidatus Brocadiaceae bacterium]